MRLINLAHRLSPQSPGTATAGDTDTQSSVGISKELLPATFHIEHSSPTVEWALESDEVNHSTERLEPKRDHGRTQVTAKGELRTHQSYCRRSAQ